MAASNVVSITGTGETQVVDVLEGTKTENVLLPDSMIDNLFTVFKDNFFYVLPAAVAFIALPMAWKFVRSLVLKRIHA